MRKESDMRVRLAVLALLLAGSTSVLAAEARIVKYGSKDIVNLRCRVKFTTLIVLPPGEKILDYVIGDRDWWVLEGSENFAYLKPAKTDISTSVTLITQAGNLYSFLADEVGTDPKPVDLKVFVEASEASGITPPQAQKYISAAEHEAALQAIDAAKAQSAAKLAEYASAYPMSLVFEYEFPKNKSPFKVSQVWHDGQFTYTRSAASEKPTLFEVKDGSPVLVEYTLRDDVYVIAKVIDVGQLAIGKKRMVFRRKSS
jgi:type IV secretion system protein VirB9